MKRVCGMHSWQNGTTCRDGVQVFWCHSHLVWATELSYLVDWTGGLDWWTDTKNHFTLFNKTYSYVKTCSLLSAHTGNK